MGLLSHGLGRGAATAEKAMARHSVARLASHSSRAPPHALTHSSDRAGRRQARHTGNAGVLTARLHRGSHLAAARRRHAADVGASSLRQTPVPGKKSLQPVVRLHASSAMQAALNSHGQIPDASQHPMASNGAEAPTGGAEQPLDQSAEDTLDNDEAGPQADDSPSPPEYAHPHYLPVVVAAWDREAYNKPPGFDSSESGPALGGFLDVAAHSVGGRLQGKWKRENQDCYLLQLDRPDGWCVMGVFDGHGVYGGKVSAHVRNAFADVLSSVDGRRAGQDPRKALWTAFRDVHESLSALPYNLARSGTTAVVCIVTKSWVATAWAGDSRAVLGRHTGAADPFSQTVDSADGAVLTTTPASGTQEASREISRVPSRTRSAESVSTHLESAVQQVEGGSQGPAAQSAAAEAAAEGDGAAPSGSDLRQRSIHQAAAVPQPGGQTLEAVDVTQDHKPKDPSEERRIKACGGRVDRLVARKTWGAALEADASPSGDNVTVGPYRVFLRDSWSPGLACSRALGDVMAAKAGVTWRPSIDVRELKPTDEYLVLASDGVWELLTSQEGLDIAGRCSSSKEAAAALVQRARERWATIQSGLTCDDVTAIVCRLH